MEISLVFSPTTCLVPGILLILTDMRRPRRNILWDPCLDRKSISLIRDNPDVVQQVENKSSTVKSQVLRMFYTSGTLKESSRPSDFSSDVTRHRKQKRAPFINSKIRARRESMGQYSQGSGQSECFKQEWKVQGSQQGQRKTAPLWSQALNLSTCPRKTSPSTQISHLQIHIFTHSAPEYRQGYSLDTFSPLTHPWGRAEDKSGTFPRYLLLDHYSFLLQKQLHTSLKQCLNQCLSYLDVSRHYPESPGEVLPPHQVLCLRAILPFKRSLLAAPYMPQAHTCTPAHLLPLIPTRANTDTRTIHHSYENPGVRNSLKILWQVDGHSPILSQQNAQVTTIVYRTTTKRRM